MSDSDPFSFMVRKNSVITDSDLIAQTKPKKSFWGKETTVPLVFSLYITNSKITTDALDGEVALGTVHIPAGSPVLTADYQVEGWSEAFVLCDAEINLQQEPKGKRLGSLSVSSSWLGRSVIVEDKIDPHKCDIMRKRLNR